MSIKNDGRILNFSLAISASLALSRFLFVLACFPSRWLSEFVAFSLSRFFVRSLWGFTSRSLALLPSCSLALSVGRSLSRTLALALSLSCSRSLVLLFSLSLFRSLAGPLSLSRSLSVARPLVWLELLKNMIQTNRLSYIIIMQATSTTTRWSLQ